MASNSYATWSHSDKKWKTGGFLIFPYQDGAIPKRAGTRPHPEQQRVRRVYQVFLLMVMVGNLEEKSLFLPAMATATLRATAL